MPASIAAADDQQEAEVATDDRRSARTRRRAIVASSIVAALVLGSMVWGGTTAMQAVAAERRLEALRVDALGSLLDARSEASELLAVSQSVVSSLEEQGEATLTALHHADVQGAHGDLAAELARALPRETPISQIIAQSRLLESNVDSLEATLDAVARGALEHARSVRAAAPLATTATIADLDAAVAALSAVRQGLPSSYSGRASLVTALLAAGDAVTASHVEEKAEQERLAAERRAAEEAAARRSTGGSNSGSGLTPQEWFDQKAISEGCVLIWREGNTSQWDCPPGHWMNPFPPG